MRRALELLELERSRPSRFRVEDGEVIHSHCDAPMTLVQRGVSGEERWFCTTCRESVYLPQEAWLFLMEQVGKEKGEDVGGSAWRRRVPRSGTRSLRE